MRFARKKISSSSQQFTIVHLSAATGWRGGEQQLAYLLSELEDRSIQQILICPSNSELQNYCTTNNIAHFCFAKNKIFFFVFARSIYRLSKSAENPIFHAHDSHSHTAAYLAELFFSVRSPLIVSRRVDFPVGNNLFSKLKYNARNIAWIVCVSNAIKNIITPVIKDPSKIVTIHSGVDASKFLPTISGQSLRNALDLPESVHLIGNTSAISDHKDYYTFIDACVKIHAQNSNTHFIVIGDGPLRDNIEAYAKLKKLDNKISFLGFRTDVPSLLPQLSVFLFPSKTEGLGTSVLDAFASAVPVVATNTGGIPEMVLQGQTGLLCEVGDSDCLAESVCRLLDNKKLIGSIVLNAGIKLKEFEKSSTADKTIRIYKEVSAKYFDKSR